LIKAAIEETANTIQLLKAEGVGLRHCRGELALVTFEMEGTSGVYNELQCGSYIFMDADYQACKGRETANSSREFEKQPLHLYVGHEARTKGGQGHLRRRSEGPKRRTSGMPVIYGADRTSSTSSVSDEHGVINDPHNVLRLETRSLSSFPAIATRQPMSTTWYGRGSKWSRRGHFGL